MRFEFATAGRIVFGEGAAREVGRIAAEWGRRALVVTGRAKDRASRLIADVEAEGVACRVFGVEGEPTLDAVRSGVACGREARAQVVIGFGGGSAIDGGKAVAALLANEGELLDYLEVIGKGKPLARPGVPFIAVPTTAGTGSEVTRNAVLASPAHRVKVSLRSPLMLPRAAVVDPELTYGVPPAVTAATGLDALTQLIEPYVSSRANPMTDALCLDGIARCARSLARAYEDGTDREARHDMALASLFGGLALANAGLGAVHGFAAPAGGMFPAPHGAVCAALLPHIMEANIRALRARAPESGALERYAVIARALAGSASAAPEDGAAWVAALCRRLEIPRLREWGIREQDADQLAAKAARASSMKGNPIPLTHGELIATLAAAV